MKLANCDLSLLYEVTLIPYSAPFSQNTFHILQQPEYAVVSCCFNVAIREERGTFTLTLTSMGKWKSH